MKIIAVDNYARENVSDTLVAENVNSYYAPVIAKYLNDDPRHEDSFYKAVEDDYTLYTWEP